MAKIRIDSSRCLSARGFRCGQCVDICPEGLFLQPDPRRMPRIPRQRACIDCGHCVSICPQGAVEHVNFPREEPAENPPADGLR